MESSRNINQTETDDKDIKKRINEIIDGILEEAFKTQQFDLFFSRKAAELRSVSESCFSVISKRFLKSSPKEKDIILNVLKYIPGIEHIKFLQDYIRRESFLPRTGMQILDLFNKSDAIVESGLTTMLLDLDSLTQRIKHALILDQMTDSLAGELLKRSAIEKEGIINQLLEETGARFSSLIIKILSINKKDGLAVVDFVTRTYDKASYMILEDVYNKTSDKDIAKILKTAAHTLKQKGVDVAVQVSDEPRDAIFKKAVLPQPRSFVSAVDAEGCRIIFMVKPITMYESKIFNIMMSYHRGIHDIEVINTYRKESQVFINRLLSDKKIEFLETENDYAGFLVEEACSITEAAGKIVSGNIAQWKNAFSDLTARTSPLIYDLIKEDRLSACKESAGSGSELFDSSDISYWFVVSSEGKESWIKLTNILYSPLSLSDEQKKNQVNKLIADAAVQFFSEAGRKMFKRRLEELSYFLYKKGREEKAALALAIAALLDAPGLQPDKTPFCLEMVRRGLAVFDAAYKKADSSRGGGDPGKFLLTA